MATKKKISVIAGSFILVAAVVACVAAVVINHKSSGNNNATDVAASIKAVKDICEPTTYRTTCENTLTKAASNTSDVKSIIKTAVQVAIDNLKDAAKHSALVEAAAKDPTTYMPLQICMRLFDFGIQDLKDAVDSIQGYELEDLHKAVSDLKNWISAASTSQETCLDEFNNKNSEAAVSMRKALNLTMELTANAIEIIHQIGEKVSLLDGVSLSRRLLDVDHDGSPTWLSAERRTMLGTHPFFLLPTMVVAQDGTGQFSTIQEAIDKMPRNSKEFMVLFVKAGVYREQVYVDKTLQKLILIGEGPTKTRITNNFNVHEGLAVGIGTYQTATFAVDGNEFMARDIGFENTAGPTGHQAVAFRSQSDFTVMLNCHFDGFQDTLYPQSKRQFYRDCTITGTVDFIFGNARAIFQNCNIIVRKPLPNQQNMVTAHGSKHLTEGTAFVLHNCIITGEPALVPKENPTYLGRPWKQFARTIFMQSYIDGIVDPLGYVPWPNEPQNSQTCLYSEMDNRGPGANTNARAPGWQGVHTNYNLMQQGLAYTLDTFFVGADWVKGSGAPFDEGMLPPQMLPNQPPVLHVTPMQVSTNLSGPINFRIPPPSNKNKHPVPSPKM